MWSNWTLCFCQTNGAERYRTRDCIRNNSPNVGNLKGLENEDVGDCTGNTVERAVCGSETCVGNYFVL